MKPLTSPLTSKQRQAIIAVAGQAYRHAGSYLGFSSASEMRHRVADDTCGISSVKEMNQQHFVPVYNAFAKYAGRQPLSVALSITDKKIYLIKQAADGFGFDQNYIASIAEDKFGIPMTRGITTKAMLSPLTCDQLTQLLSTINNRGRHSERRAPKKP